MIFIAGGKGKTPTLKIFIIQTYLLGILKKKSQFRLETGGETPEKTEKGNLTFS